MKRLGFLALIFAAPAFAEPTGNQPSEQNSDAEFVGRYDGSSFETAMGMEIREDGTFGWGVSVGALDMRAKGSWMQDGNRVFFTSDPKPLAPEFAWSGLERTKDGPWIKLVWASNGKPFEYASAAITCKNGWSTSDQIRSEGWPPDDPDAYDGWSEDEVRPRDGCDQPETVQLRMSVYDVRSETYSLSDLGWKPGETARFEFRRNDMGVADFTGVTGYLDGDVLKLQGADWPLEMRKLPPRD